jgi:hypothetical protein
MDVDRFWELIERSGGETKTREERLAWLEDELCRRPAEEIVDYYVLWKATQDRGCTMDLYAAYWFVFGSGSLDGFEYFVSWLISLGRETFEGVVSCPDSLIELPHVLQLLELKEAFYRPGRMEPQESAWAEDEWPEFELLAYVAYRVYPKVSGRDVESLFEAVEARDGTPTGFPLVPAIEGAPHGERWDFADEEELLRRLPRIARYRGL